MQSDLQTATRFASRWCEALCGKWRRDKRAWTSMKTIILIGVTVVLLLLGLGRFYMKDSATVEQALLVEKFFQDYCRQHSKYPEFETVKNKFPELYPDREWYYWPNETRTVASFQYPMTLPLSSAPGRSKVSEFVPIIYSYVVHHPCRGMFWSHYIYTWKIYKCHITSKCRRTRPRPGRWFERYV